MMPAMSAASSTSRRSRRRRPSFAAAAGRRARSSSSQLPYSAAKVCSGFGSLWSTHAAIGSEARIIQGVSRVVSAETATATGYRKSPVACSVRPSPAMMKENSPICARLSPARTEVRIPIPVRKAPSETPTILPTTTVAVSAPTASQWRATSAGSMSMPTETKNTAANTSRTGSTRRSTCFSSPDSATSDPARNAPSAIE